MSAVDATAADLPGFKGWIVANGGRLLESTDAWVFYESAAGESSVTIKKKGPVYVGDARLAFAAFRCGTTLSPFAIHPVEPSRVVQSLRARAAHTATIIADASLDPDTGAAGWAAWMKADGMESSIVGEQLDGRMADSGEAELFALAGALRAAECSRHIVRGAEVLLQSDSLWALAAIRAAIPAVRDRKHATAGCAVGPLRKSAVSGRSRSAIADIVETVDRLSLMVAVRHVPGHRSGDGRQWVNRECDRVAKQHMRAAKARITGSTHPDAAPRAGRTGG